MKPLFIILFSRSLTVAPSTPTFFAMTHGFSRERSPEVGPKGRNSTDLNILKSNSSKIPNPVPCTGFGIK